SDCYNVILTHSYFLTGTEGNKGGVSCNYTEIPDEEEVTSYFQGNTFRFTNSTSPALKVISTAAATIPLFIDYNSFTSEESSSFQAMMFSNIYGGSITNNTITNYQSGIQLLSSSADIYGNTISSDVENSTGISAIMSTVNETMNGSYFLGGYNNISTSNSLSPCMTVRIS
ncbi:MAG: hypothetical protein NTV87_00055, partial [Ignavibacteriae bacterium]|nr:hypothetical protein [Ignavibacteriota bacterium]